MGNIYRLPAELLNGMDFSCMDTTRSALMRTSSGRLPLGYSVPI